MIAHFGEATGFTARPLPDQATQQLADLVARRRQIVVEGGSWGGLVAIILSEPQLGRPSNEVGRPRPAQSDGNPSSW